jgi:DNA adenine methylase
MGESVKEKNVDTLFPWVGNKKYYISFIKDHLPKGWDGKKNSYIEPFLGSAVVFLELQPKKAILADSSEYLIDIFQCIKSNPRYFLSKLKYYYAVNTQALHTEIKGEICSTKSVYIRAAMFFYLLRTSLYSFVCMKKDGKSFTCCYKSTGSPLPFKDELYWRLSEALSSKNVSLYCSDFAPIIDKAKKGDLLFIDPPYMNLERPSRKIYNAFTQQDHERLVDKVLQADKRGCHVMMFNHDHPYLVERLTKEGRFTAIPVDHQKMRKNRSHFATYKEVLFLNKGRED